MLLFMVDHQAAGRTCLARSVVLSAGSMAAAAATTCGTAVGSKASAWKKVAILTLYIYNRKANLAMPAR